MRLAEGVWCARGRMRVHPVKPYRQFPSVPGKLMMCLPVVHQTEKQPFALLSKTAIIKIQVFFPVNFIVKFNINMCIFFLLHGL